MSHAFLSIMLAAGWLAACADDSMDWCPLADAGPDAGAEADAGSRRSIVVPLPFPAPHADEDAGAVRLSEAEWFGDSGWSCCWRSFCHGLCDSGDVPAIGPEEKQLACVPDVGQCDDRDADAGELPDAAGDDAGAADR